MLIHMSKKVFSMFHVPCTGYSNVVCSCLLVTGQYLPAVIGYSAEHFLHCKNKVQ